MKVVILQYNAGNTCSVENAFHRLGIFPIISDDINTIVSADKVIFPGVGHAESAMRYLRERNLDTVIKNLQQPVLGICLGQQLMCSHSEEGDTDCLGIFPVAVKRFPDNQQGLKIPQIGWNALQGLKSPLFNDIHENSYMYFVHSYYCALSEYTIATTDYILPFSAAIQKGNFYATQFHPEKSADVGAKVLENFINSV